VGWAKTPSEAAHRTQACIANQAAHLPAVAGATRDELPCSVEFQRAKDGTVYWTLKGYHAPGDEDAALARLEALDATSPQVPARAARQHRSNRRGPGRRWPGPRPLEVKMAATESHTITATIARVTGRGFTTRERPNTWLNLSRYAKPTIPPADTEVRVTLDADGYVRAIEAILSPPELTPADTEQHPTPPTKDATIVRMAAIKAAARLMGADSGTDSVLALAAKLGDWIKR